MLENTFQLQNGQTFRVPQNAASIESLHKIEFPQTPIVLLAIVADNGLCRIAHQTEITKTEQVVNCFKIFAPCAVAGSFLQLVHVDKEKHCALSGFAR